MIVRIEQFPCLKNSWFGKESSIWSTRSEQNVWGKSTWDEDLCISSPGWTWFSEDGLRRVQEGWVNPHWSAGLIALCLRSFAGPPGRIYLKNFRPKNTTRRPAPRPAGRRAEVGKALCLSGSRTSLPRGRWWAGAPLRAPPGRITSKTFVRKIQRAVLLRGRRVGVRSAPQKLSDESFWGKCGQVSLQFLKPGSSTFLGHLVQKGRRWVAQFTWDTENLGACVRRVGGATCKVWAISIQWLKRYLGSSEHHIWSDSGNTDFEYKFIPKIRVTRIWPNMVPTRTRISFEPLYRNCSDFQRRPTHPSDTRS